VDMCTVVREKNWRVCEKTVRRCFKDAVLISADTLPQRTEQSDPFRLHLVGLPLGSDAR